MGEGLLTGASPKPFPAWVTTHKTGNLGHTAQLTGAQQVGRVSFPGGSVGPDFFQAAWLVSEPSLQLCPTSLKGILSFY